MDAFVACKKLKILKSLVKVKEELILLNKIKSSNFDTKIVLSELIKDCDNHAKYRSEQINIKKITQEINLLAKKID